MVMDMGKIVTELPQGLRTEDTKQIHIFLRK